MRPKRCPRSSPSSMKVPVGGAVGVLPEADLRLVVAAAGLEHLDEPAEVGVVVVPVVVHHRRSGVVRDGDRPGSSGCAASPRQSPSGVGGALGEGGEDRGPAGDVAVDDVLVAVLGRGPFEAVERHEAAGHVQQVGDLLDAPPLVGGGVLGVVGHRPEVVLVDVPGVAVEVLQRRLVAGGAAADQRVPVQVAPVQLVGLAVCRQLAVVVGADRGRPPPAPPAARRRRS